MGLCCNAIYFDQLMVLEDDDDEDDDDGDDENMTLRT